MRALAALLVLLVAAAPLATAATVPIDTQVTLLDSDGQPAEALTPGSGGQFRIDATNRYNASVNLSFSLIGPEGDQGPTTGAKVIPANGSDVFLVRVAVSPEASPGVRNLTLKGIVFTRNATGDWTHAGNLTINTTLRVVAPTPEPPFPVVPVALAAGAIGLGGVAVYLRMRQPQRRMPPERSEEEIQRGVEQRRESIREAKIRDVEESIERARDRMERGEITEYQFERIKERKEEELDELRGDGDDG